MCSFAIDLAAIDEKDCLFYYPLFRKRRTEAMFKHKLMALFMAVAVTASSAAATLSLHQKPEADSKIVGQVDLDKGVLTIYQPKSSEWVKVANPANGDVGWVRVRELRSFSPVMTTQVIRISRSNSKPSKELEHFFKEMNQHQQWFDREMQAAFPWAIQPVIVPVVIQQTTEKKSGH